LRSMEEDEEGDPVNFFTEDDERLLQYYADRNARSLQFVESPSASVVPTLLYPEALGVLAQAGANPFFLFSSLKAASVELFGTHVRKRKRKRTAYYNPCS